MPDPAGAHGAADDRVPLAPTLDYLALPGGHRSILIVDHDAGEVADPARASWRQVDAWLDSLVRS